MPKYINSPVFGEVPLADSDIRAIMEGWIKRYPLDAFQILNKDILNPKGYMIALGKIGDYDGA